MGGSHFGNQHARLSSEDGSGYASMHPFPSRYRFDANSAHFMNYGKGSEGRKVKSSESGSSGLYEKLSDKTYRCLTCAYTSLILTNMKNHVRTHTGEMPYKCHLCNHQSNQRSNLKMHMLRSHKFPLTPSDPNEFQRSTEINFLQRNINQTMLQSNSLQITSQRNVDYNNFQSTSNKE